MSPRLLSFACAALLGFACDGSLEQVSASAGGSGGSTSGSSTASSGGGGSAGGTGGTEPELPYCNRGPSSLICNPYGVALDRAAMSESTYWSLLDDVLRVHFYRPETLFLDQFDQDPASCPSCDEGVAHGYYLVLVVRNDGSATTPSSPPADLALYQARLGQVIDRYQGSLAAVVIEHEADSPASYEGTPEQYLAQLAAGCEAAHQRGAHCTDSGISSTSLLLWLAHYYAQNGNPGEALRILRTAGNNPEVPAIFKDGLGSEQDAEAFLATQVGRIDRSDALLAGHRGAGVDSANLHWYEPSETTFDEILALVRTRTGCTRLMTDELGQRGLEPQETEFKLVLAKELGLPFVVWFSADTDGSRSLVDDDGTLRPSGERFAKLSAGAICGD